MTEKWLADLRQTLPPVLNAARLGTLTEPLLDRTRDVYQNHPHGDAEKWEAVIAQLPDIIPSACDFARAAIHIGEARDCDDKTRAQIKQALLKLNPWRKGPFDLFGVAIDGEWRADFKWARLSDKITPLRDRRVLDVGCGNGYYLWRMLGEGAQLALGIDPTQLFIAQFNAVKKYAPQSPAFVLPLTAAQFPVTDAGFDSVFSMGVLSHRRDPHAHLRELFNFARDGGEVIVETLVTDGDADYVFSPDGRYAKMRNVHFIPSTLALEGWLREVGAGKVELLDTTATTVTEQRATEWMEFQSLCDFLDPRDSSKTIEGHPAPVRAVFRCGKSED